MARSGEVAMPDGGDLFLETVISARNGDFCRLHQVQPGPFVRVTVSDTGLGLASAYGIIKNHGGII